MDNAARIRQRVLALFLPVAAVLYIGGEALSPKGTDQVLTTTGTAFKVLPIAAQHPAQLYLASSLVLLGLGALAVSYGAIATLVTARGSLLAVPGRARDQPVHRGHHDALGGGAGRGGAGGRCAAAGGRSGCTRHWALAISDVAGFTAAVLLVGM
jgi:hypothetical protein